MFGEISACIKRIPQSNYDTSHDNANLTITYLHGFISFTRGHYVHMLTYKLLGNGFTTAMR